MNGLETGMLIAGRYRLLGLIGSGGMGAVYAAEDTRLGGMLRAIKAHRPHAAGTDQLAEEAALLMRLNHPRLPAIVDYIPREHHGMDMFVMSYIDGIHLKDYVERRQGRPFEVEAVVDIGLQLAETLDYLHTQHPPVIHRDLKPTNVMIQKDGTVKLIDFGIARCYKPYTNRDTRLLGTPGFAAPEQEGGTQSDARTDVYGLGALLYYMLSGGAAPVERSVERIASNGRSPADARYRELESFVVRMLAARPAERYPDMKAAYKALAHLLGERSTEDRVARTSRLERSELAPVSAIGMPYHSTRCKRIVVASIAAGAGATSVALTVSHLLSRRNRRCAAFEYPGAGPEWHSLLQGGLGRESPTRLTPLAPGYTRFEKNGVLWHARYSNDTPHGSPAGDPTDRMQAFGLMERNAAADFSVIDLSTAWKEPDANLLMLEADIVLFVADPDAAKWSGVNVAAAERLRRERQACGRMTCWAANKDISFRERMQWLSLFPIRPHILIPHVSPEKRHDLLWKGKWLTDDRVLLAVMEKAYEPLIRYIVAANAHKPSLL
ncbi:serine/threonine protein kinase [Paenibacillus aurantiacus]|uniref:Serine/threonine protein kinase n=1 Tax=Paenibacillus aurantiacus TaxID=1936118 RepID=A0ABV5L1V8_9BACL